MQHLITLICIIILLGLVGMALAEENDARNLSPVIFSFSAASPVKDAQINFTLNTTTDYSQNESIEAYYNNLSLETDTSLPKLVLLGIPMECHFCMIIPSVMLTM